MSAMFQRFTEELARHAAPGYHRSNGPVAPGTARATLQKLGVVAPEAYVEFLERFGTGRYFGGALVLFDLEGPQGIASREERMHSEARATIFPFAYDGTTEGCFCLDRRGRDPRVFWCRWGEQLPQEEAGDFETWIESLPADLFNAKIYRGYGPVRDPRSIDDVVAQRSAVAVRLIEFDEKPVIPPDKRDHKYPRYHRFVVGVTKQRAIEIPKLTVKVVRDGSRYGADNVDYVSLDIASIPPGKEAAVTGYSFDGFNVPFARGRIEYQPSIDLGSKMRVRFAEIAEFL